MQEMKAPHGAHTSFAKTSVTYVFLLQYTCATAINDPQRCCQRGLLQAEVTFLEILGLGTHICWLPIYWLYQQTELAVQLDRSFMHM